MQTLISPDNHWALLLILFSCTSLSIYLEQKYKVRRVLVEYNGM